MKRSVDTVLFDLDGTLVEYGRPSQEVLDVAFDRVGVEPFFSVEAYYERYEEFLGTDVSDIREHCFEAIASDHGLDPAVGREVAAAFGVERDHAGVRLLDGARAAVEFIAEEHEVGLVTNGPPDYQQPKLDATGFGDLFSTVVFAGYDTAPKPDPEPFDRALDALGADPGNAAYVGNSLAADVAGAAAAGLRSVWLDDGSVPDPVPDHVVESLRELHSLPWR